MVLESSGKTGNKIQIGIWKEVKFVFRLALCPYCKTGKRTYELDRHSPFCPYLSFHTGKECAKYEKNDEYKNIFKRILTLLK